MTLLSVVIPVYNREKFIEESVRSVLNQKKSGCTYEVIVIDDGSTDETPKLLSKFGNKIIYKRIKNSGRPAVPRNVGIKIAKGDFIAFQDSDDIWVENKLNLQLKKFVNSDAAVSYGNAAIIDEKGNHLKKNILTNESEFFNGHVFGELVKSNFISTLTTIVRKPVLTEMGGFDESFDLVGVEDYHLWLRIAAKYKVTSVNEVLAMYRSHSGNISSGSQYIDNKKIYNLMDSIKNNLPSKYINSVNLRKKQAAKLLFKISPLSEKYIWILKAI